MPLMFVAIDSDAIVFYFLFRNITCRRRAKSRQSLTFPAPDPEHAFQQLLQSLLQRHVLIHFYRALGTRRVAHHRRSLGEKKEKRRENYSRERIYPATFSPLSSLSRVRADGGESTLRFRGGK